MNSKLALLLWGRLLGAGTAVILGMPAVYYGVSHRDSAALACGIGCILLGVSWSLQPRAPVWPFGEDVARKLRIAQDLQRRASIGPPTVISVLMKLGYVFAIVGTLFSIAKAL